VSIYFAYYLSQLSVYLQLSTDDTYFQPWTLGSRSSKLISIFSGPIAAGKHNYFPVLYPSNDPVLAFPSNHPTPFEAPRFPDSHLLPAPLDNSSPPNASSSTINPALLSTPLQLLPPPPPLPPMPESLQSALTLKRECWGSGTRVLNEEKQKTHH
jgi:hypothetical protein